MIRELHGARVHVGYLRPVRENRGFEEEEENTEGEKEKKEEETARKYTKGRGLTLNNPKVGTNRQGTKVTHSLMDGHHLVGRRISFSAGSFLDHAFCAFLHQIL